MRILLHLITPFKLKHAKTIIEILWKPVIQHIFKLTSAYKVTLKNLKTSFTETKHSDLVKLSSQSMMISLVAFYETIYSWSRSPEKVSSNILKVKNRFLIKHRPNNKGTILFSFHNRSIDMLLTWIINQEPCTSMYTKLKNGLLNKHVEVIRSFNGSKPVIANISGVKKMLLALNRGEIVNIASDQVAKDGMGVESKFFNTKCYSTSIVSSLARKVITEPILIYITFEKNIGYTIKMKQSHPMISSRSGPDTMHQMFEEEIIKHPAEYAWEYKKFRKIKENKDLYKF